MHIEGWKIDLLLFVLLYWPWILGGLLATLGYGLYRLLRRPQTKCWQHRPLADSGGEKE